MGGCQERLEYITTIPPLTMIDGHRDTHSQPHRHVQEGDADAKHRDDAKMVNNSCTGRPILGKHMRICAHNVSVC